MYTPQVFCPCCLNSFKELKPMILECGHSICQLCLRQIGSKPQFRCFYCKKPNLSPSGQPLPSFVNYGLWGLIKTMANQDDHLVLGNDAFDRIIKSYREQLDEDLQIISLQSFKTSVEQSHSGKEIDLENQVQQNTQQEPEENEGEAREQGKNRALRSIRIRKRTIR